MLDKELRAGRIAGPFDQLPFQTFICSPLGKIRIIHDLSHPKGWPLTQSIHPSPMSTVWFSSYYWTMWSTWSNNKVAAVSCLKQTYKKPTGWYTSTPTLTISWGFNMGVNSTMTKYFLWASALAAPYLKSSARLFSGPSLPGLGLTQSVTLSMILSLYTHPTSSVSTC